MESIIKFVKNELLNDHSGHDYKHIERVVSNAYKIIKYEGGNEKIIITSCYLHDIVDNKLFLDIDTQINKIKELLIKQKYNEDEILEIIDIITSISYSKNKDLKTLNAMIVRDADRLDAIGAIGIIRTIEYGNNKLRPFYEEDNIKKENNKYTFNISTETTLSHFYDKLLKLYDLFHTETAKEMGKRRTQFLKQFLEEFYSEL